MNLFKNNRRGQNVVEYLVLMAGVLTVLIVATGPNGFFTRGVDRAIDVMFDETAGVIVTGCTNPISPSNARMCDEDNVLVAANTSWVVVAHGGCTNRKCEYECNLGYVRAGNDCVLAQCTGAGFGNATMCPGDAIGLSTDTPMTLVPNCSDPAGSPPKCEQTCNGGYIIHNGGCCLPGCPFGSCGIQSDGCGGTINCGNCCGNGAIDGAEQCDGSNYAGSNSCTGYGGPPFTGGTLSCNSDCTVNTSACCTMVDGGWTGWSGCSNCIQTRTCTNPSPQCGGSCSGAATQSCYSGTWSTGAWGACSASCGGGTQTRSVDCSNSCCDLGTRPPDRQSCNTQPCGGTWSLIDDHAIAVGNCATGNFTNCPGGNLFPTGSCSPTGSSCQTVRGVFPNFCRLMTFECL